MRGVRGFGDLQVYRGDLEFTCFAVGAQLPAVADSAAASVPDRRRSSVDRGGRRCSPRGAAWAVQRTLSF